MRGRGWREGDVHIGGSGGDEKRGGLKQRGTETVDPGEVAVYFASTVTRMHTCSIPTQSEQQFHNTTVHMSHISHLLPPSLYPSQAYRLEPLLSQSYKQVKPMKVDSAGSGVSHNMAAHAAGTRMQEGPPTEQKKGFLASLLFGRDTKPAVKEPTADQVSCIWGWIAIPLMCVRACVCACEHACVCACEHACVCICISMCCV